MAGQRNPSPNQYLQVFLEELGSIEKLLFLQIWFSIYISRSDPLLQRGNSDMNQSDDLQMFNNCYTECSQFYLNNAQYPKYHWIL